MFVSVGMWLSKCWNWKAAKKSTTTAKKSAGTKKPTLAKKAE